MRQQTRSFYTETVQRTIARLVGGLDKAADLRGLAAEAGLSPFYFHRLFRGMVGETLLGFQRRLRMERAAWSLLHGTEPVTGIAFDAGYETQEAFSRAFRACYGTAPSAFRRHGATQVELAAACGVHFRPDGRVSDFVPRETGGEAMHVKIIERPALRLAAVRHKGSYHQIGQAFERLGALAGEGGLFGHADQEMIAIYYDDVDSTPPEHLHSDAALTVPEDVALPEGLEEQRLPAGRYACYLHVGSYSEIGDAWSRLIGEWLPASGRTVREAACYEVYLNTPGTVAEDQLQTAMYLPVA